MYYREFAEKKFDAKNIWNLRDGFLSYQNIFSYQKWVLNWT
jgi:hypothetical protein